MAVVAIAAGVAALGAYSGAVSARKQAKKGRDAQAEAARKARKDIQPDLIAAQTQRLQPLFRENIATGLGANFQQQVGANLASHGLTGTGYGEALRNASFGIPEIEAFRRALEMGYDIQKQTAAIRLGAVPSPSSFQSPNAFGAALSAGAGGYFAGKSLLQQPNQTDQTNSAMANPLLSRFPGLYASSSYKVGV